VAKKDDRFSLEDGAESKIDWKGVTSGDLPASAKTILDVLGEDKKFKEEVNKLLGGIKDPEVDLKDLQAQIQSLIATTISQSKLFGKDLGKDLEDLSSHLMNERSGDAGVGAQTMDARLTGQHSEISKESRRSIKDLLRRLVVYQLYELACAGKIQFAGETKEMAAALDGIRNGLAQEEKDWGDKVHLSGRDLRKIGKLHSEYARGEIKTSAGLVTTTKNHATIAEHDEPRPSVASRAVREQRKGLGR